MAIRWNCGQIRNGSGRDFKSLWQWRNHQMCKLNCEILFSPGFKGWKPLRKHKLRREEKLWSPLCHILDMNPNLVVISLLRRFAFHITKGSGKHYENLKSGSEHLEYTPLTFLLIPPSLNIGNASPVPSYQGRRFLGWYRTSDTF